MSESQPISRPPRQKPHWFRFSLRTLLLVVAGVAIWLGIIVKNARRQQAAIMAIRDLGGETNYDYQFKDLKAVGETQITDEGLLHLYGLTKLKKLWIQQTQVTDEGVNKLQVALPALKSVVR